ncbi:hypothetical protein SDC9_188165 [bioreactor metagenome]|uniref:Uncharacterized protein n=1 Tax=bioreactor metagenome TaxID=1076179 RepID=A0A645HNU2_9ZZZZ
MAGINMGNGLSAQDERGNERIKFCKLPWLQIDALPGLFEVLEVGLMGGGSPVVEFLELAAGFPAAGARLPRRVAGSAAIVRAATV